jgi:hypothetical protein
LKARFQVIVLDLRQNTTLLNHVTEPNRQLINATNATKRQLCDLLRPNGTRINA